MKKLKMELDIISNLPDEVIEEILSQLPIRDAVRTSILSTKWRYKWKVLQHLEFDERCVSAQSHPTSSSFVNIVDHVLLLHTGPIHLFRISNAEEELATRDMDRWIIHVCRNPVIKYMMIDVWKGDRYNIPSCLFSCQDIVHLDLFGCLLKPRPCKFKGFRSLKTVDFRDVTMTQDVFENLIGSSPLLENLSLAHCDGFTSINIDAPNLLFLLIIGVFEDLNLTNTSNLTEVIIYLEANGDKRWGPARSGNLIKFFVRHPCIQKFTNRNFLKYPSVDVLPDKLPNPCQHLNFLSVNISFDDPDGTSIVLCLLKSSPALKELEILVDSEKVSPAVKEVESSLYDNYNCTYTQLRLVKMTNISGAKVQLDFIKFLLLNSPVLERVSLRPASVDGVSKLLKDLLLLKRDSKHAEIMIMDP